MADDAQPGGLWARSRQLAYAEIATVAMDLFLSQGFEETTIDQIVGAVGISRRSFFRYFGTKEDIVLGGLLTEGAALRDELARRPDEEDIWSALRGALTQVQDTALDQDRTLAISRMMYETSSLRARSIEKHLRWCDDLLPEVERRLGEGAGERLNARAIVSCVITCLDLAGEVWTQEGGVKPLMSYYDTALDAIRRPRTTSSSATRDLGN